VLGDIHTLKRVLGDALRFKRSVGPSAGLRPVKYPGIRPREVPIHTLKRVLGDALRFKRSDIHTLKRVLGDALRFKRSEIHTLRPVNHPRPVTTR